MAAAVVGRVRGRGGAVAMRAASALAAVLAVACTGCLPIPGYFSGAPRVTGSLVRGGEPVADAAVWWAGTGVSPNGQRAPQVCENEEEIVETAADGAFTLPGKPLYVLLFPLLPFHCTRQWNVCVSKDGQTRSLPVYGFYGICGDGGPAAISTVCDLERAEPGVCTSQLGDGR